MSQFQANLIVKDLNSKFIFLMVNNSYSVGGSEHVSISGKIDC